MAVGWTDRGTRDHSFVALTGGGSGGGSGTLATLGTRRLAVLVLAGTRAGGSTARKIEGGGTLGPLGVFRDDHVVVEGVKGSTDGGGL